jgi:hypothetical protein
MADKKTITEEEMALRERVRERLLEYGVMDRKQKMFAAAGGGVVDNGQRLV